MFHGSMVALVTPMQSDGNIDYVALDTLLDWHINQQTDAIVVAGTTGESATLTAPEKHQLIQHTVQFIDNRIPVIAGTSAVSTQQTIDHTREAMELGVDACLIMTPPYIKPTQEGLYQHYAAIAHNIPIPQIIYNIPGRTACDLLPETLFRLAKIANIIGIKEASGDIERAKVIIERCGNSLDVYSGEDHLTNTMIQQGGKGVISVTANIAPQKMHAMCAAGLAGDHQRANELDAILAPIHKILFIESNPIPVKWVLAQMGKIKDEIRLPLLSLSKQYHDTVLQVTQQLELS